MTPIDTAELERLAAEITPGPWAVDSEDQGAAWGMAYSVHAAGNILDEIADSVSSEANARAIALAPALIREVLAHRKAEAWQPISSAPLDQDILVFRPAMWGGKGHIGKAKWDADEYAKRPKPFWQSSEGWIGNAQDRAFPPSHWRPLPDPPTTPEAEGGQP